MSNRTPHESVESMVFLDLKRAKKINSHYQGTQILQNPTKVTAMIVLFIKRKTYPVID